MRLRQYAQCCQNKPTEARRNKRGQLAAFGNTSTQPCYPNRSADKEGRAACAFRRMRSSLFPVGALVPFPRPVARPTHNYLNTVPERARGGVVWPGFARKRVGAGDRRNDPAVGNGNAWDTPPLLQQNWEFHDTLQPRPSHTQPRTSAVLCDAIAATAAEDQPVSPPTCEKAGRSIVIRRWRGAAAAGFADSSGMAGWPRWRRGLIRLADPALYPATHNSVRPRYCAERPPTPTKDQPSRRHPPRKRIGERDPQAARGAAAGFADSSPRGGSRAGRSGGDGDLGSFAWPIRPGITHCTTPYVRGSAPSDRREHGRRTNPSRRHPPMKLDRRS